MKKEIKKKGVKKVIKKRPIKKRVVSTPVVHNIIKPKVPVWEVGYGPAMRDSWFLESQHVKTIGGVEKLVERVTKYAKKNSDARINATLAVILASAHLLELNWKTLLTDREKDSIILEIIKRYTPRKSDEVYKIKEDKETWWERIKNRVFK